MDRLFRKKGDTDNLGGRRHLLEVGSQVHSYTWLRLMQGAWLPFGMIQNFHLFDKPLEKCVSRPFIPWCSIDHQA